MRNRRRWKRAALLVPLLTLPAGGCLTRGDEIGLLDAPSLPALQDAPASAEPPAPAGPSIYSFDRRHWQPVKLQVPARQVENYPSYANLSDVEAPAPEYPGTATCLAPGPRPGTEITSGTFVIGYTAWLTVGWMVEMATGRFPWKVERSPQLNDVRAPPPSDVDLWPWVVFEPHDPDDDA